MNKRYKILLIVIFPFLLFFSVKSMNNSLSEESSNKNSEEFSYPTSSQSEYISTPNSVPVQLTRYSKP